jgi:hypothetical protein
VTSVQRTQANSTTQDGGLCKAVRVAIVYRAIGELKLNPKNPRLHSDKQIQQIAHSIEVFGPIVPILIDGQSQVVAGHGRLLAARSLGLKEFPTICVEHLTESQTKAFCIADNRLTENSAWDDHLLAVQLKSLSEVELDFSLEVTGFEASEIELMIEGIASVADGSRDPADVVPEIEKAVQVSRTGDLWLLGRHRLYCGNALKQESYAALMEDGRAVMVFTDLPGNLPIAGNAGLAAIPHKNCPTASGEMADSEFATFLVQTCSLLATHSTQGALHYLCLEWRRTGQLLTAAKQVYSELKDLCVWVKDGDPTGSLYRNQHELVFVFQNGKDRHRSRVPLGQCGRYRSNVWRYPAANSVSRSTHDTYSPELYPTAKPVALVADAILDCSQRDDIVLDPFVASGTTLIAAERTGRICYGIESHPINVDTAVRRWQAFTGQSATHSSSQCSFGALEKGGRR